MDADIVDLPSKYNKRYQEIHTNSSRLGKNLRTASIKKGDK